MKKKTEIIAVTNDKGGVGKTTTAKNLSIALVMKGYRTLLIDADSQMYCSLSNGWDPKWEQEGNRTLFDSLSNPSPIPVYYSERGIYYVPSSRRMVEIDNFLKAQLSPNQVLKNLFNLPFDTHYKDGPQTIQDFDYVIIDCPPSLGSVTINAMASATGLIIPVQLEGFSVRGLGMVTQKFKEVQAALNPNLKIQGFLFVMADERLVITKEYSKVLREAFGEVIYKTVIRRNVRIPESQDKDSDVFIYAPESNGAKDYMAFTEEFLAKK